MSYGLNIYVTCVHFIHSMNFIMHKDNYKYLFYLLLSCHNLKLKTVLSEAYNLMRLKLTDWWR